MTFPIGALAQIIRVTSKDVAPYVKQPPPPPPITGLEWGKSSTFRFGSIIPPNGDGIDLNMRGRDEHLFKTKIEEIPNADYFRMAGFTYLFATQLTTGAIEIFPFDRPATPDDDRGSVVLWEEAWLKFRQEDEKEIIRVEVDDSGNRTIHYQRYSTQYLLHLDFRYGRSPQNFPLGDATHGEIPR